MNQVIDWLKSIRLGKVITIFLSGLFLLVSTACSNTPGAVASTSTGSQDRQEVPSGLQDVGVRQGKNLRPEVPEEAVTSSYKKGSMNEYADTDPRMNTSKADAKAKALVDNADQYRQNYRTGTPLGERVQRIGDDVNSSTKELTEGVSKAADRGVENLKKNTQNALGGANEAADGVKSKVKSDIKTTQRGLDKAANAVD
jgi:hypothetical protein